MEQNLIEMVGMHNGLQNVIDTLDTIEGCEIVLSDTVDDILIVECSNEAKVEILKEFEDHEDDIKTIENRKEYFEKYISNLTSRLLS